MTSSVPGRATSTSESSSYRHMEHALSRLTANAGEDTKELMVGRHPPNPDSTKDYGRIAQVPTVEIVPHGQFEDAVTKEPSLQDVTSSAPGMNGRSKIGLRIEMNSTSDVGSSSSTSAYDGSVSHSQLPFQGSATKSKSKLQPVTPSDAEYASTVGQHVTPIAPASPGKPKAAMSEDLPRTIHTESTERSSPPSGSPTSVDGTTPRGANSKSGTTLRRGKWTMEEETYVARVIQDFNSGFLNAPAGTTLRSYLSDKLQCDPMRITKKFTGDACIGKRVFHPAVRSAANTVAIDNAQAELDALERRWQRRLEMQQRESAKKAAASAAAANAASGNSRGHSMIQGVPLELLSSAGQGSDGSCARIGQNVVTQAASWLDRANAILKGGRISSFPDGVTLGSTEQSAGESIDLLPNSEIENQMKEVQRLIFEGPQIQQTTAGLPNRLGTSHMSSGSLDGGPPSPPAEPADKRMRTGNIISGAEDAEALVGFLRSVRASAAAGQDSS